MNTRNVIEKCREHKHSLYLCFIDYSKAFDCVSHPQLWTTTKKMGFPCHLVELIASLYQNQQSAVNVEEIQNGLKSEEACARDVSYHQTSTYTLRSS